MGACDANSKVGRISGALPFQNRVSLVKPAELAQSPGVTRKQMGRLMTFSQRSPASLRFRPIPPVLTNFRAFHPSPNIGRIQPKHMVEYGFRLI